jgi:hypothetical protein
MRSDSGPAGNYSMSHYMPATGNREHKPSVPPRCGLRTTAHARALPRSPDLQSHRRQVGQVMVTHRLRGQPYS